MSGIITKIHFFQVLRYLGLGAALRLLVSREQTALSSLIEIKEWRINR